MKVIVIIHDGIVSGARTDIAEPLEVEVLDIDKDYEDYERLKEYEDQLYSDPALRSVDPTTVHFDIEEDE